MFLRRTGAVVMVMILGLGLTACSGDSSDGPGQDSGAAATGEQFPDVVKAEISGDAGGPYSVAVTMKSPYDSAERYADSMRVRSADGDVYGERKLGHDHAGEQPFTRDITDVKIPGGISEVVVEGHDQKSGWGGDTVTIRLP